jgi:hypothetical protein
VQLRNTIRALWLCTLCYGCEDLSEFKTGPDDVFIGEVVGSDSEQSGDSFIRKGFASHTLLELRFNPNASGVPVTDAGARSRRRAVPGMVHTYVCPAGKTTCSESERTPGPFDQALLLAIDGLAHDTLSQYSFPGGGRLHNYIFSVRFSGETAEGRVARDAMIFVSLMETGQIEVRAIAPSVLTEDGETERLPALFGVFVLRRDKK